jgi:hypothetical protein
LRPALRRSRIASLLLVLLVVGGSGARGQEAVVLTEGDGLAAMQQRVTAFVQALVEYTRDVRLSEAGLESVLDHYAALEDVHGEEEAQQIVERAFRGDGYDFGVVVDDPTYVAWCRERGLEPEPFFRQFLRLQALWMREESLGGLARALEELPGQRAEIDAAREQMGDEAHARAVADLDEAQAMIEDTRAMMEQLPVPGGDEAALLEKHRGRVRDTLGQEESGRE